MRVDCMHEVVGVTPEVLDEQADVDVVGVGETP
jgi:hypothetical protein